MRAARVTVAWLAVLLGAGLTVVAFRVGYADELGSRAGAEPELAGLFVAVPFFALVLGQVAGALVASLGASPVARVLGLVVAVLLAGGSVAAYLRLV